MTDAQDLTTYGMTLHGLLPMALYLSLSHSLFLSLSLSSTYMYPCYACPLRGRLSTLLGSLLIDDTGHFDYSTGFFAPSSTALWTEEASWLRRIRLVKNPDDSRDWL